MNPLRIERSARLSGSLRCPSDKSLTHRALLVGGIASSKTTIQKPLLGEDCLSTARCLRAMGVGIEIAEDSITVSPPDEWHTPSDVLDCGNSGTTMRLLAGFLASRPIRATLVGDASLSRRPMGRVIEPLKLMGAEIHGSTPPLEIVGGNLSPIDYTCSVASAQVKSCILFAGLRCEGVTRVTEPSLSRDHTERLLTALGADLHRDGLTVHVRGPFRPEGFEVVIPADISSAAFFAVAAALVPGSALTLEEVGVNPSRTGLLNVLQQAGVDFEVLKGTDHLGEPAADIQVRFTRELKPFEISGDLVPRLIDEIPVLAVLATQCHGTTVIRDARELRVKESDRIELMVQGLRQMGAKIEGTEDGMVIEGPTPLYGTAIDCHLDHRIGMSFAVAGLIADGATTIEGAECIATSYPSFAADMMRLQTAL